MKKTLSMLALVAVFVAFGACQAFAVPIANGTLNPDISEWANTGYNYYLSVDDPQEAGIPDEYNIKHVVLLQELEGFGYGDGISANDGLYLLIETYGTPSFVDPNGGGPKVTVYLDGDFGSTVPNPGFDFSMVHTADANGNNQTVTIVSNWFGPTGDLVANGGAFGVGTVIEYFIPSGPFHTPSFPFPLDFFGQITYDNGGDAPDDSVAGRLAVPEPGTMLLLGAGLIGLVGFRKFSK